MMKIAILDQDSGRVIVAEVPEYLESANASSEDIASAILTTLGLPSDTEHMIGGFKVQIDVAVLNEGGSFMGDKTCRLEELTANFKEDALAALNDN